LPQVVAARHPFPERYFPSTGGFGKGKKHPYPRFSLVHFAIAIRIELILPSELRQPFAGVHAVSNESNRLPALLGLYREYLDKQDTTEFITKTSRRYTQGTLQRLAESDSPEIRRAAALALGFVGDYEANYTLGRALQDEDRTVRIIAENSIRNVWTRAGDEHQRQALGAIVRYNSAQHYDEAVCKANELLEKAPWYAEAWNQRAIAHFSLGHFTESIRDCHQALEINPYHFAAAAGMGQAYLQLGNVVSALESFRRALRLNPDLEAVRVQISRLTKMIEGKSEKSE
jgi:tetratricopeptide (TPR) repeat protein